MLDEDKVRTTIEAIRPAIQADGGDIFLRGVDAEQGIVQVELPRRQALLEAQTTVERLDGLIALLEREVLLLGRRLRYFSPDPASIGGARRS